MICHLQFVDNDIEFSISELNTEEKVTITMAEVGNELYGHFMELGKEELFRLKKWIDEAVEQLSPD